MGKLTYLVLHCTATPEHRHVTSDEIRRWHTAPAPKGRGWKQVGYSEMIHLNGEIETLVKYDDNDIVESNELTNGALGINSISRHIVYVGGIDKDDYKPKDTRTPEQLESMKNFVLDFVSKHPGIKVAGHYHFAQKACPSFNVEQWLKSIGVEEKNIYSK